MSETAVPKIPHSKIDVAGDAWILHVPRFGEEGTHFHTYGLLTPYFKWLAEGRLMGTRCVNPGCPVSKGDGSIWLPPRADCPDCHAPMVWKRVEKLQGYVYTYTRVARGGTGLEIPCPYYQIDVKIPGVADWFTTSEGVREEVVTIIVNIRKIRLKLLTDEPQTITLSVKGPKDVTAADLKLPGQVEILNPEQRIADVTGKVNFELEIRAERGLGYIPKEEHQKERVDIGTIALDAIFSPIRRANYEVENMRVGDRTDFNRLRILIETDGTIAPREALERSIETMIHQLKAVVGFKEEETPEMSVATESRSAREERAAPVDAEMLKTRITELNMPQRVEAALDNASIRTVGGLVRKREDDLLAIEGLGQKGLQDIKRALSNLGLTLRSQ